MHDTARRAVGVNGDPANGNAPTHVAEGTD